ncbi:hypothetical protein GR168_08900 [Gordonia sp. JH63]|uniref:hypothetical protein n=1 Tax=Gordonia sp. JH63 TaxID=2698900 RepID=UPI00131FC4FE|nr:hypothetical protein [Gordonia sp. JH63]QHD85486.1 hypothetical protein GR168_08900 [Gordonia sp. JH63]
MTTTKSPMAEQPDAGRAPGLRGLAARLRDERAAIRGERLTSEDAPFWFVTPALGWSVVLQLVWVFDEEVSIETLTAMNAAFARGRLNRMLVVPDVVGARPRWVAAPDAPGLAADSRPVPEAEIDDWATAEMSSVPLDAEGGRCWRLRSAPTASGGTVVSLCALHVVTDGRGMLAAAAEAASASEVPLARDADRASGADPAATTRPPVSWRRQRIGDLADAGSQAGAVLAGLVRAALERRKAGGPEPDPRPVRAPIAERSPAADFTWATATVPATDFDRVAAEHDGTANTLFIAVVTGLLRSSGHAPLPNPIKVGVPVDRRESEADTRSNPIAGVSVYLTDEPVAGGDLGGIRAACKAAFVRLSEGRRAPHIHLRPLAWFLPPAVIVKLVSAGNGIPDAVISNLGDIPPEATVLGGRSARKVAFRGMAQGVDASVGQRFGDGVQSWLVRTRDQVTFTVLGCDETSFPSDAVVADLLDRELTAWGLPHEIW